MMLILNKRQSHWLYSIKYWYWILEKRLTLIPDCCLANGEGWERRVSIGAGNVVAVPNTEPRVDTSKKLEIGTVSV